MKNLVKKYPRLGSSQNPNELSLTIKSIALQLIPLAVVVLGSLGVEIAQADLVELVNQAFSLTLASFTIWGIIRKFKK
mgnify:CR=1 FL=1